MGGEWCHLRIGRSVYEPTYEGMLTHAKTRMDPGESYAKAWKAEARATLGTLLKRVSIDESRYNIFIEDSARPATAIRRVAAGMKPDLLVMGTRGRGRLRRAFFGSVAAQVLRTVDCDVLVVPDGPYEHSPRRRTADLGQYGSHLA